MPLRPPRSPEPRGNHGFGGALSVSRLSPTSTAVPDPLTLTTLNLTNLVATSGVSISVTGSLVPVTTDTWNLGGITKIWANADIRNLFVDVFLTRGTHIVTTTNIVPNTSETIGESGTPFSNGFFSGVTVGTLSPVSTNIFIAGHLVPSGTRDLGLTGTPFRELFSTTVSTANLGSISGAIDLDNDLDIQTGVSIDFSADVGDLSATSGASQGFIKVKVGGIVRLIEYFAVS